MTERELLDGLAPLAFHAVLVFARLGSALILLPGLGELDIPANIRLGLGLLITALLVPVLAPGLPAIPDAVPELLRLLVIEIAIGLWLGMLARLLTIALALGGQFIALMIGLASPLQTDPVFAGQGTETARLFGLAGATLVLASGLYAVPLRALVASYTLLPPGEALPLGAQAETMAAAVGASVALALRLAAPLVLASVIGNFALGLLSRLAPQVQVFGIAAPGQIILGLLLLALLVDPILAVWRIAAEAGFEGLPGLR
jgi:flagellar biosynthetic protein FliR